MVCKEFCDQAPATPARFVTWIQRELWQLVGSELVSTERAEVFEENAQKSMLGAQCMLVSVTDTNIDLKFLL